MCLWWENVNEDEMSDGEYDCTMKVELALVLVRSTMHNVPSIDTALNSTDQNSIDQNGHVGSVSANKSGDVAARAETDAIRISTRTRCTQNPVERLRAIPTAILGRKRREVSIEERFCTFWKLCIE